jgi:hypothetical protein
LHSCRALSSQPHVHSTREKRFCATFPLTNHIPVFSGKPVCIPHSTFIEPLVEGMMIALEPKRGVTGASMVGTEKTSLLTPLRAVGVFTANGRRILSKL